MDRTVNLIEYLPAFIAEYREMKRIMEAENPEFQLIADEGERIKNNQFIISCDSSGISKFEKLLNITPYSEDSLDSRKFRVLSRWGGGESYTWETLLQKMNSLCDTDFEVRGYWNQYELRITTHLDQQGQIKELENILDYMIPANIEVISDNDLIYTLKGDIYTCAVGSGTCEIELTNQGGQ